MTVLSLALMYIINQSKDHHIERNCNLIKNKIEKIRKMKIYKTIAQMRFNSQHNLQHNTCK